MSSRPGRWFQPSCLCEARSPAGPWPGQDDVLFGNLTVRETFRFAANIRLPPAISRETRMQASGWCRQGRLGVQRSRWAGRAWQARLGWPRRQACKGMWGQLRAHRVASCPSSPPA